MNYYKVTSIQFDFKGEDLTEEEQNQILQDAKECLWDVPDIRQFKETIYNNLGYTVLSLKYDVLN